MIVEMMHSLRSEKTVVCLILVSFGCFGVGEDCSWAARPQDKRVRSSAFMPQNETLFNHPDNTLPLAVRSGRIQYFILSENEAAISQLSFDVEAALKVWVKALRIAPVDINHAASIGEADIVINVRSTALNSHGWTFSGSGAYFSDHQVRADKIVPVIELRSAEEGLSSDDRWVTVQQALQDKSVAWSRNRGAEALTPIKAILGEAASPEDVADFVMRHKSNILDGKSIKIGNQNARLVFGTLVHELGHVFSLDDLYDYPGNIFYVPKYKSVMGDQDWKPLYPTAIDRARARKALGIGTNPCLKSILKRLVSSGS